MRRRIGFSFLPAAGHRCSVPNNEATLLIIHQTQDELGCPPLVEPVRCDAAARNATGTAAGKGFCFHQSSLASPHRIAFHVPTSIMMVRCCRRKLFQRLSSISSRVLGALSTQEACMCTFLPPAYPQHESTSRSCFYAPDSRNNTLRVLFQYRRHL